ncbi:MAG: SRPBCC domain-containing protein [Cyclobacteriaceae bacterium]
MKDVIKKEQQINFPIQDVWKAISTAEEISTWFIHADFKAEPGFEYTFTHEETKITGKVLEASPFHTLIYTWIVGGTGVETTVKWNLKENDSGTFLTLEHSGISNYPTEEMATNMFTSFEKGWGSCVVNLTKYLNKQNVS